jgi:hypothetical protein
MHQVLINIIGLLPIVITTFRAWDLFGDLLWGLILEDAAFKKCLNVKLKTPYYR